MSDIGSLISPETAAAFTAHMHSLNLDPGPTLLAHGVKPTPAAPPTDPAAATEAPPSINSTTSPSGITAQQADATYQYLLGQGIPEADIIKALEAEGYQHVEATEAPANDAFQAGSADDYVREISGAYVGADIKDLPGLDRAIRDTLARIEMPLVQSRAFVENIMAASRSGWAQMSEAAKATRSLEEVAGATRALGVSREQLMATAKLAMDRVPRPFAEDMARQGIPENRNFLVALYQAGQRIEARGKK